MSKGEDRKIETIIQAVDCEAVFEDNGEEIVEPVFAFALINVTTEDKFLPFYQVVAPMINGEVEGLLDCTEMSNFVKIRKTK